MTSLGVEAIKHIARTVTTGGPNDPLAAVMIGLLIAHAEPETAQWIIDAVIAENDAEARRRGMKGFSTAEANAQMLAGVMGRLRMLKAADDAADVPKEGA